MKSIWLPLIIKQNAHYSIRSQAEIYFAFSLMKCGDLFQWIIYLFVIKLMKLINMRKWKYIIYILYIPVHACTFNFLDYQQNIIHIQFIKIHKICESKHIEYHKYFRFIKCCYNYICFQEKFWMNSVSTCCITILLISVWQNIFAWLFLNKCYT